MKSAKLLPLSHWIAFLVVGIYPLCSGEAVDLWPWTVTFSAMAVLGGGYHLGRALRTYGQAGWWGLSLLGLDALLVCFLIYHSGGISSPLFPLLFLLAATASLYDHWTRTLLLSGAVSAAYVLACTLKGLELSNDGSRLLVNVVVLLGASVLLSYLAELDRREHSKAERMEGLYHLSSKLMEQMDLEVTLKELLMSTASFFKTDVSSVRILDRRSGKLVLEASSEPAEAFREARDVSVGEGLAGWVAERKEPVIINDIADEPRLAGLAAEGANIRSALAAPIMVGGELMGVLTFGSTQARDFSPDDLKMLMTISNLAASVITRSELYQMVISRSEVIVSSMSSGLLITDPNGKVIMSNQASQDLLGLEKPPRDLTLSELLESTLLDVQSLWEQLEDDVEGQGGTYAHVEMRLKGRPERILSVRMSPIKTGHEPYSGLVVILEDITERVKVDEIRDDLMLLIARRVEEQTALYEVGKSLVDEAGTRNLLQFLLSKAVGLVEAEYGILSLCGEEGRLQVRAVHGLEKGHVGLAFLPEGYLVGEALARGEPLRRAEVEPGEVAPWGERLSFSLSYMAAPITWQGKVTGVIEVAKRSRRNIFGEDDLRLLSLFVNQAAIAIENSNLYRLITEDQRRTEAMLHSINDGVIAVNNDARIMMVNPAAESILNLQPFSRIQGRHIKEVIRHPDLSSLFLKSLNASQEMEHEIRLGPPDSKILEVETSVIETAPGERIGIIAVIRDVTALRELEQAKSDFVSTVSHELRTPLTSIKAYTATLRRRDVEFDEDTSQEFLRVVEEETDRLTRLISDLLDISRIESGRMELKKRDFDMAQLVRIVTDKLRSQATGHAIALDSDESVGPVYADVDKIEQVIMNLLDNAIKYSPAGGEIGVELHVKSRRVEFSVHDHGVGIPVEHLEHIFDKFHRVDNRATRKVYGTGLGLYVSKNIVEAHGGTIWAESVFGEGSTFRFTLPLSSRQSQVDDIEKMVIRELDSEDRE